MHDVTIEFEDGSEAWFVINDEQADLMTNWLESMEVTVNIKA